MSQTWFINGRHMNIAEVREWRASKNKEVKEVKEVEEVKVPEEVIEVKEIVETTELPQEDSLEELQRKYTEKTGKKLVGKYAKDVEWLKSKLNS